MDLLFCYLIMFKAAYQKGSNIRKELKLLVKFYKKLLRKFLKIII